MMSFAAAAGFTVKLLGSVAVPPPGASFVTATSRRPKAAFAAMVILAVICAAFSTEIAFTVMSAPKSAELTPLTKSDPVNTTFNVWPRLPLAGEIPAKVGEGLVTVKG